MSKNLTISQVATQLHLSKEAVRSLCRSGQLEGTFKKSARGPWLIPIESVNKWLTLNSSAKKPTDSLADSIKQPIEIKAEGHAKLPYLQAHKNLNLNEILFFAKRLFTFTLIITTFIFTTLLSIFALISV